MTIAISVSSETIDFALDTFFEVACQAEASNGDQKRAIERIFNYCRKYEVNGLEFMQRKLNEKYPDKIKIKSPIHKTDVLGMFSCPKCGKVFSSQAALSGHGVNRCRG